jgi:BirA family biotin operon repressor/biotin-[acetyl-CoA-carboxylase] ligase
VVVGMGVNLAHHPEGFDRPVASLASLGVAAPDPATFLEALAEIFAAQLATWRSLGIATIRTRWLERAHPIGTALSVSQPDGTQVEGLFAGLDQDCALMLRLADGAIRAIHAGDVFLV